MNKSKKSEFFSREMRDSSELVVRYVVDDVFKLPFDLSEVYSWIIEYGTLYVKHKETDSTYTEYVPTFNYMNDSPDPFHFPDLTLLKSYKNNPMDNYRD